MWSNIKLWLTVAGGALIAGLLAMLKIKSSQLDKAESDVDKLAEINHQNKEVRDVEAKINAVKDEVDSVSDAVIRDSLHEYDRSREGGD